MNAPARELLAQPDAAAVAISVRDVRKAYRTYDQPLSFLVEVATGRKKHREKEVLRDISLEIKRGEVVGIIGRNGAGKSTLLKMIAGTLAPTSGRIDVTGRVSAILELGTGFNSAYSGRDNVIMSGLMRGMSEGEVRKKFDAVVT
ncbi:MAG TPA: ATP-binding cassette domain-containing protein, partial [Burkholderiaceae bacterium]|nr:ATP-binding cassette domain-containing protein [Burkholderiaceae bacterium]